MSDGKTRAQKAREHADFHGFNADDLFQPNLAAQIDDTRSWVDPNGYRLSDRLWAGRDADRGAIDTVLREGLSAGDSVAGMTSRLREHLHPDTPGGNYAARRLARTETTRAFGAATIQAGKLNPFPMGIKCNLSGSHTEPDECNDRAARSSRDLERGEYTFNEIPRYPAHPNCLCYLTPVSITDDEFARHGSGDFDVNDFVGDFTSPNNPNGGSAAPHLISDGKGGYRFSAERQALHDEIVHSFVDGIPQSSDPTVHMLGGGPAAGKSTMLKSGSLTVPEGGVGAVLVNPDEMKERLPEYRDMVRANDEQAASFVHEESSYLAKRAMKAAIERGQDVLVDGVGVNYGKMMKVANPAGYKTKGYYAFLPDVDDAVTRANARAAKTGRAVPETYIREKHWEVSSIFNDAASKMESMSLYDTSSGAKHVAEFKRGKQTFVDQAAYDHFLSIGEQPKPVEPS